MAMAEKDKKSESESDSGYTERSREFISKEIEHHVKEKGMPQDQAVAAAMSEARRKGMKVPPEEEGDKD